MTEKLEELLKYGWQTMNTIDINISKQKPRTILVFSFMGAIQSYSNASLSLLKTKKYLQAEIYMRPLTESYINMRYIFSDRTQKHSKQFLVKGYYDNLDWMEKIVKFLKKYPNFEAGILRNEDWETHIRNTQSQLAKQIKKGRIPSKQLCDLRERAKICDKSQKPQTEWLYLSTQKYFSDGIHLNSNGLSNFLRSSANGDYIFTIDGDESEKERIEPTIFSLYFDSLYLFLKYFKIRKLKELYVFRKFITNHNKKFVKKENK